METFDPFTDYLELSRMINRNVDSLLQDEPKTNNTCITSLSHDLMEMDDQSQDYVFFNEDFPLTSEANNPSSSSTQKPLWMNFENGDVFYSHNGTMPDCLSNCNVSGSPVEPGFQDFTMPVSPFSNKRKLSDTSRSQSSSSSTSNISSDTEATAKDVSASSLLSVLQGLINDHQSLSLEHGLDSPHRKLLAFDEKACALCKKNGETREFYTTHVLKDTRGRVICPVLRKYVCPKCGATGDNAHTLRHCPVTKAAEDGATSSTVMKTVQTPRSSCGRRRKALW